jgi:hypothetical protein
MTCPDSREGLPCHVHVLPPAAHTCCGCWCLSPTKTNHHHDRDRGLKLEVHTREGNPFKMSDLRKV